MAAFRRFPAGKILKGRILPAETYEPYRLTGPETAAAAGAGAACGLIVGILFFRNALSAVLILPGICYSIHTAARSKGRKRRQELQIQLRDYLLAVISALRSGYALENALRQAFREMVVMHGEHGMITEEAEEMVRKLSIQTAPENAWQDFYQRSRLPEAGKLADTFRVAKKQGGDYLPVLQTMADAMEARRLVREETETVISGQKMEYKIMCFMPAGLLLYLNVTAPENTQILYEGTAGHVLMAGVLAVYLGACLWGSRILEKVYE